MQLQVEQRSEKGKGAARRVRRRGLVPATVYGPKIEVASLSVDPKEVTRILESPKGRNTLIELTGGVQHHVVIRDLQRDPVRRNILHLDFHAVDPNDIVTVAVPVRRLGRSKAEALGARLAAVRRTLDVTCTVSNIPAALEFDVSELQLGDQVTVSEFAVPEGGEIVYASDFVVINVEMPRGADEDEEGDEDEDEDEDEQEEAEASS